MRRALLSALLCAACGAGGDPESTGDSSESDAGDPGPDAGPPTSVDSEELRQTLGSLALPENAGAPPDVTNQFADDPAAAELGHKLFVDTRFSGPLLDSVNNGIQGTLGLQGETGKVACASCHVPENGNFVDTRSPRAQLSLASGWTHRRAPSLLDVSQARLLTWDGRFDNLHSVVFNAIESALEFNSSRLFVAQQVYALYKGEYEAVFGPIPESIVTEHPVLEAANAGCAAIPSDPINEHCVQPEVEDEHVTRVVVNFGKAVAAYLRQLSCGPSRFDAWLAGNDDALSPDELAGARLFADNDCALCHSGPYLTDQKFHNIGHFGDLIPFTGVDTRGDLGAAEGLAKLASSPLNSRGAFSDGDDGRAFCTTARIAA
jgi:cytochrome c peroxidase